MRLIHLSDIHFGGYGDGWDENKDQRNELLLDVESLVREGGPADGVLVGGDIAYHAREDQYDEATTWLKQVCEAGQCLEGRVWVVPGNHDVDRSVHGRMMARQVLLQAVRSAEPSKVTKVLNDWFLVDPAAEGLLHCLAAYNAFAGQWGCETTAKSLSWKDETLALDGLDIYLSGLNSAIVSDTRDWDGGPTLALGGFQCELPRAVNRVHIAFVHHPPTWIRDWDRVESRLRKRAHVLLFGHEHVFAARQNEPGGTVEVFAGAVGPHSAGDEHDNTEHDLVPSWNMITLERDGAELVVTIDPRVWRHDRFVAHTDGQAGFRVNLDLGGTAATDVPATGTAEAENANPLVPHEDGKAMTLPPAEVRSELRELAVRFMKLTPVQRDQIAEQLGLDEGLGDVGLSAREHPREILRRVSQAGKVSELREAMGG